jgi:hypothetical protein
MRSCTDACGGAAATGNDSEAGGSDRAPRRPVLVLPVRSQQQLTRPRVISDLRGRGSKSRSHHAGGASSAQRGLYHPLPYITGRQAGGSRPAVDLTEDCYRAGHMRRATGCVLGWPPGTGPAPRVITASGARGGPSRARPCWPLGYARIRGSRMQCRRATGGTTRCFPLSGSGFSLMQVLRASPTLVQRTVWGWYLDFNVTKHTETVTKNGIDR